MIFVDTGAWFEMAVRSDPDHVTAMAWLERNYEPLLTTDYILAETATLIRMRDKTARGHRLAENHQGQKQRAQAAQQDGQNAEDDQAGASVFEGNERWIERRFIHRFCFCRTRGRRCERQGSFRP